MPRPPRIDFPDAVYHVTSRGNGRADIFYTDEDGPLLEAIGRQPLCDRPAGLYQLSPPTSGRHWQQSGVDRRLYLDR